MLTEQGLAEYIKQLKLTHKAETELRRIRQAGPSRNVSSRHGNVSGRYCRSLKMGRTRQFESHKNELAYIREMEYDKNILEYYDQPPSFKLEYKSKTGKNLAIYHTPDFFILETRAAGWVECKTKADLEKLVETQPNRFICDEKGEWRCPPGEAWAAQFGFFYRVRCSDKINWYYQRNMSLLEDYLIYENPEVPEEAKDEIVSIVSHNPGITLAQLREQLVKANIDNIFTLLVTSELIYFNLYTAALADSDKARIFRSEAIASAYIAMFETGSPQPMGPSSIRVAIGEVIIWDGVPCKIINIGETMISLLRDNNQLQHLNHASFEDLIKDGKLTTTRTTIESDPYEDELKKIWNRASPEDLEKAYYKYKAIQPLLDGLGLPEDKKESERTLFYWLEDYKVADKKYCRGFVGLLSQRYLQGNRNRRLPEVLITEMQQFIRDEYETPKQENKATVYGKFLLKCEEKNLTPPSYKTFIKAIKERPRKEQVESRKGMKAAYNLKELILELEQTTPRHGDFPFERAYIDHTPLDQELIHPITKKNLGKPWLSLLIDAYTRLILAIYLSFDAPSYRSCMMIVRECVRRYGRLPANWIVDGGKEFGSIYFEALLAMYGCNILRRPWAQPHFGSVVERIFDTTNTRFVYNVLGNTQNSKNVRQMTRATDPKRQAVWSLGNFYPHLREFCYSVYANIEHPALGQTPLEAYADSLFRSGQREHVRITYDDKFKIFTLPTTRLGEAQIEPRRGIQVNYIYYWSNFFRDDKLKNTKVLVKYDPYDISKAYAYVNNDWQECHTPDPASFRGYTEQDLMVVTQELRQQYRCHNKRFAVTQLQLAQALSKLDADENELKRIQHRENSSIIALINEDTQIQPSPPIFSLDSSSVGTQDAISQENAMADDDYSFEPCEDF
jgi:transposase InsO family protein